MFALILFSFLFYLFLHLIFYILDERKRCKKEKKEREKKEREKEREKEHFINTYKINLYYYVTDEYRSEISKLKSFPYLTVYVNSEGQTLQDFLEKVGIETLEDCNKSIFFYAGHSFGYYVKNSDGTRVGLGELRQLLEPLNLSICIFDSSAMSTLECLYELRNCTDYIIGCEGYRTEYGFLTEMATFFIHYYYDQPEECCKKILEDAYISNQYGKERWNGSVLSTKEIRNNSFLSSISSLSCFKKSIYELPYLITNYAIIDLEFSDKVVIDFRQNLKDTQTYQKNHGLGLIPWINRRKDRNLYQNLQLYKDCKELREMHYNFDYDHRMIYFYKDKLSKADIDLYMKDAEADFRYYNHIESSKINIVYLSDYKNVGIIKHVKIDI